MDHHKAQQQRRQTSRQILCFRLTISEVSDAGLGQTLLMILPKNVVNLSSRLMLVKLTMVNKLHH